MKLGIFICIVFLYSSITIYPSSAQDTFPRPASTFDWRPGMPGQQAEEIPFFHRPDQTKQLFARLSQAGFNLRPEDGAYARICLNPYSYAILISAYDSKRNYLKAKNEKRGDVDRLKVHAMIQIYIYLDYLARVHPILRPNEELRLTL